MNNNVKNAFYTLILLTVVFAVWKFRNSPESNEVTSTQKSVSGQTMGTYYNVIVFDVDEIELKKQIDSLLVAFNKLYSTYDKNSWISNFNQNDSLEANAPGFDKLWEVSEEVHRLSDGGFDPTVMPLIRIWGFGPDDKKAPDSTAVEEAKQWVGLEKIVRKNGWLIKENKNVELDFSAVAKGFGVDVLSEFLSDQGFQNHFVEIGGEVRTKGVNQVTGKEWSLGIVKPEMEMTNISYYGILKASNRAVATSGNYFNYYKVGDRIYSHTIDPHTGYPEMKDILSATIIADNCAFADAAATACMVMGHKKAIEMIEKSENMEGVIIFTNAENRMEAFVSTGISEKFKLASEIEN